MNIRWTHFDRLPTPLRDQIEQRLKDLGSEAEDLIDVHLTGYESPHHRHGDCEVRIVCRARRRQVVTRRKADGLSRALQESVEALERTVRDQRDRDQRAKHYCAALFSPNLNQPELAGISPF